MVLGQGFRIVVGYQPLVVVAEWLCVANQLCMIFRKCRTRRCLLG